MDKPPIGVIESGAVDTGSNDGTGGIIFDSSDSAAFITLIIRSRSAGDKDDKSISFVMSEEKGESGIVTDDFDSTSLIETESIFNCSGKLLAELL